MNNEKALPTKERVAVIKTAISIFNKKPSSGFEYAASQALKQHNITSEVLSSETIAIDMEKIQELRHPLGLKFSQLNGNFTDDVLAWMAFHDVATAKAEAANIYRAIHQNYRVPNDAKGWSYLYSLTEGWYNK